MQSLARHPDAFVNLPACPPCAIWQLSLPIPLASCEAAFVFAFTMLALLSSDVINIGQARLDDMHRVDLRHDRCATVPSAAARPVARPVVLVAAENSESPQARTDQRCCLAQSVQSPPQPCPRGRQRRVIYASWLAGIGATPLVTRFVFVVNGDA